MGQKDVSDPKYELLGQGDREKLLVSQLNSFQFLAATQCRIPLPQNPPFGMGWQIHFPIQSPLRATQPLRII